MTSMTFFRPIILWVKLLGPKIRKQNATDVTICNCTIVAYYSESSIVLSSKKLFFYFLGTCPSFSKLTPKENLNEAEVYIIFIS